MESVGVPRDIFGKRYLLLVSISSDASEKETGIAYVNWESAGRNSSFSAPTVTASYIHTTSNMVTSSASGKFIVIDPMNGSILNISNVGGTIKIEKG